MLIVILNVFRERKRQDYRTARKVSLVRIRDFEVNPSSLDLPAHPARLPPSPTVSAFERNNALPPVCVFVSPL